METPNKTKYNSLSVAEAVEALSSIAELEFDHEVTAAKEDEILFQNQLVVRKASEFLHEENIQAEEVVKVFKQIFHVILNHLRRFSQSEQQNLSDQQTIEGIKNIMVIVGEASKKLNKYTTLFQKTKEKRVTEMKEYHQLQEFYLRKIAKRVDESMLSKWVLALSLPMLQGKGRKKSEEELQRFQSKHIFVDLDTVKRDDEYELFFIRKDDGSRFFSPRLLRNIKLICDFGDRLGEPKEPDPLSEVKFWIDYIIYKSANQMLQAIIPLLEEFRHETQHLRHHEVVADLNKAIIALMLSSHERQLLRNIPTKSCQEYFADFQQFLRQALHRAEYQKMIAYPPNESNKVAHTILSMAHALCYALFMRLRGLQEAIPNIRSLVAEARASQLQDEQVGEVPEPTHFLWDRLSRDYKALYHLIQRRHQHGPLLKVLDILDEESYHSFDPLLQHNIPCHLFDIEVDNTKIPHVRFASPVYQEYIHSAKVIEEFKGMLREGTLNKGRGAHLLINLQDKTQWREYCRSSVVEDLPRVADLNNKLIVVTLAKDTDFYHQEGPYEQQNHADIFIEQFKEHLEGENAGFCFPEFLKKELFSAFIDQAMDAVHQLFFSGKNVLTREQRLDFIEIFYLFLELKLVDLVQPSSFSLTCKDGIDRSQAASAGLFILLQLLNGEEEKDWEYLDFILYAPSLLIRERVILADPFNRMIGAIKRIEMMREEMGEDAFADKVYALFEPLYLTSILHGSCKQ